MPNSTQSTAFPYTYASSHLVFLFIPSPALSFLAFILTKPFGATSLYIIPAAFFLTSINHIAIYWFLYRKPFATIDVNAPSEIRFRWLRHLVNICIEGLTAAAWLVGAAISIVANVSEWSSKNSPQDIAAASFAILEGCLMITITVFSWKLREETRLSRAIPDVVVMDSESVDLMDHNKTNV